MSKQVPRVSDKIVSLPSTNKRKASPSEKEDIVEDIVDSDFTDDEQGSRDSKGDKSVNKKTKTTPKLRTVPAEPPQELPKPTHNKPIANVSNALVKSGPSEVLQPEWKKGVHKSYADNPQYFRNINLADIRLIFQEPYKGSHQAERITPVLKGTYNEWLKKDKKKQAETNPMPVNIASPPMRCSHNNLSVIMSIF